MRVRDIMKKDVYTISPQATLKEAIEKLYELKVSGLIVANEKNEVVGILSEKDVYRAFYPSYEDFYNSPELFTDYKKQEAEIKNKTNVLVQEVMTQKVIKIDPDEYIMKVGSIMLSRNIHRLPVVNKNGKLVGVISRGCIYRSLFRKQLGF